MAAAIRGLGGWRRRLLAIALGAAAALALPPLHWVPVLWLAFPGLVWLADGGTGRRGAFGAGWWFGFGHFSAGLYWVSHALLTDPARFGWMIPFAVFGLGGVLAVFPALAVLAMRLSGARGAGRVSVLAGAWTIGEWLRSWMFTGFPWNLTGTVWMPSDAMLQFAALTGAYGLSLVTVLAAALPAVLGDPWPAARQWGAAAAGIALLAVVWAGGALRLATADSGYVDGVRLRLVQANIAQNHKWRDDLRRRNLADHVALSRAPGFEGATHVVWPETAAPYFLTTDAGARQAVASAAPPGGAVLTGAPRATPPGEAPFQVWNSLIAVDPSGAVTGVYDKAHLVPFGEYVPLRGLLPIAKITHGGTDFSAGPGPRTMAVPGLPPFSPLICYEGIFPAAVVGDGARPAWLLNVTNDAWFGFSAGPYQHLAAARMRAIEEGLPLVRAANTGISVVTDAYGRVVAGIGLGKRGVVDSGLPAPLVGLTPFAWLGVAVPLLLSLAFGLVGMIGDKFSLMKASLKP
ncbi:MAG: apolipoprotein N-acyltransferase [Rhodospirillales bacterium]|nr:apolipoprotein N-acyltransferase [Rhodospirillales bacterium]